MSVCRASYAGNATERSPLRVCLDVAGSRIEAKVWSEDVALEPRAEALAIMGLMAAMREHLALEVNGDLDGKFLRGLKEVAAIHRRWDPSMGELVMHAAQGCERQETGDRVALFFSGGVDSFYSLLENEREVTDLVFVHGFDIAPGMHQLADQAEKLVRRVGASFGKRVIRINTDIRSKFMDPYCGWGMQGHGVAMAAVAHLLGGDFKRVLFAACDSVIPYVPWGTHPELDPLWSANGLTFVHDHCGVARNDKIRRVAQCGIACSTLRVCWKNRKGRLNCGRCEKCLRTMLSLEAMGLLDRFEVFDSALRFHRVAAMAIPPDGIACYSIGDNLKLLAGSGRFNRMWLALKLAMLRRDLLAWLKSRIRRKEVKCPSP